MRILLVEDNDMNQQVATELLESAGAVVTIANHGGEAVKILQRGPAKPLEFDVVLMDLQMPEMDGYTATRLLRADPRFKDLPIIAMTAHALVEERQRCLDAGMNDHVTKPIDPDALFAALKRWTKPRATALLPLRSSRRLAAPARSRCPRSRASTWRGRTEARRREQASVPEPARAVRDQARGCRRADRRGTPQRRPCAGGAHRPHGEGCGGQPRDGPVQSAAERVERAILEDSASVPLLLEQFGATLGSIVQAIRAGLAGTPGPGTPREAQVYDAEKASAAASRLRELIEANDGDAADAFTPLEQALSGTVEKAQLDLVREALGDFDFDRALSALVDITRQCGLSGDSKTA